MTRWKDILFNNFALKLAAFALAVFIWAIIAGNERTSFSKSLKIPVEITNVASQIEIKSIKPEEIQLTLQGATNTLNRITPENLRVTINLKDFTTSAKINFFAEDQIVLPEGISIVSIHPKMIEIAIEEFRAKEVPIRIRFRGKLNRNLKLVEYKANPDRVTVLAFQSNMSQIAAVFSEEIDLAEIAGSETRRLGLILPKNALKFRDRKDVNVQLTIETDGDERQRR